MSSRPLRPTALALLAALALGGCAATAPPAPADAPAPDAELEALYWQRQQDARAGFTPADVTFMTDMIGHHAQALVMSRLAPTHGASPAVQRLAARIINAQNDEIESMQRWLRQRGQPVPEIHIDGLTLMVHMPGDGGMEGMDHGGMHHGGTDHGMMPGMLTQAQLEELDRARGADFDRLFLTGMIGHHGGAIVMVDALFGADGAAQDNDAFKLASDINVDQKTEIARMELVLRDLQ